MNNSPWQRFYYYVGGYLLTLIMLLLMTRMVSPTLIVALWLVALIWGGILAYQLYNLLEDNYQTVIMEKSLRKQLQQAQGYQQQLEAMLNDTSAQKSPHLEQLSDQINHWTESIKLLAEKITRFKDDDLIRHDLKQVPKAITDLEKRIKKENDPVIKTQLQRTLNNRRTQQQSLQALQKNIKRAEIQIESTISQMGTIYSHILTGQSGNQVADYSRLAADVDEEVTHLQEQLETLQEVRFNNEF
ncbi:hypothetical protein QUF58_06290 [Anaerolineales bacterium HSG24]|nr:hypothetical protein [Anaerolineales bacterium HSG24]